MTKPLIVPYNTYDEAIARSNRPDKLTLISMVQRPGVLRFFTLLEWTYFTPGTPENQDYEFMLMKWPEDAPIIWTVVILPFVILPSIKEIAEQTGMRIGNGIPMMIGGGGVQKFPIHHERAFTMENDHNSPIYLPNGPEFIQAEEQKWLIDFFAKKGMSWP